MPLCPQITNTPITVTQTADFTVTNVVPVLPANTQQLAVTNATAVTALADAATAITTANTAISTANTANATATAAAYDAGVAQTTANSKSKVTYSTAVASGSASNGDIWFRVNGSGSVITQYVYNGGWLVTPITDTVIANLDAGKITAGTITGIAYNNGSGTFSVSPSGNLVASSAVITGAITATSGTFTGTVYASAGTFTGTVTATSGSFTGTITSTSGNVGGFFLNASSISSGSGGSGFYLNTSGVANFSTVNATGFQMVSSGAMTLGGGTISGASTIGASGTISTSGTVSAATLSASTNTSTAALSASGAFTYPGISTGSGSTMVVVSTGSRVAYTTSSERFKQDIEYIATDGWLDKVLAMKPITYKTSEDYTTAGEPNETQIGFLAEDINDIGGGLETAVILDPLGDPFSLSYDRLTVFLMLAIKELKAEIDQLKGA